MPETVQPGLTLRRAKVRQRQSVSVGLALLAVGARPSSALSVEAVATRQAAGRVARFVERSDALFGAKNRALSDLYAIIHSEVEEGAEAAVFSAAVVVGEFIRALPDDVPLPEFALDPDGAISLDWIASTRQQFSLSIGDSRRLALAWIDGTASGHAVEYFDGLTIPSLVLSRIHEILRDGESTLRAT